jgi:hypothetical protein
MKQIRFSLENWMRFETHNKSTTWRTSRKPDGIYELTRGTYYKPQPMGFFMLLKFKCKKRFMDLTEEDAKLDGFDSLSELKAELKRLNPAIHKGQYLYCSTIHRFKDRAAAHLTQRAQILSDAEGLIMEERNGAHFAYASFSLFVKATVKEKVSLKELVRIYEV